MTLKEEFIPYAEASILKELGFEEPCFGYYTGDKKHLVLRPNMGRRNEELNDIVCTAPLYQQAFRWFRDKHKLKADVTHATSNGGYTYTIWKWNFDNNVGKWERIGVINSWLTYEEAELECLKKLIEIVK